MGFILSIYFRLFPVLSPAIQCSTVRTPPPAFSSSGRIPVAQRAAACHAVAPCPRQHALAVEEVERAPIGSNPLVLGCLVTSEQTDSTDEIRGHRLCCDQTGDECPDPRDGSMDNASDHILAVHLDDFVDNRVEVYAVNGRQFGDVGPGDAPVFGTIELGCDPDHADLPNPTPKMALHREQVVELHAAFRNRSAEVPGARGGVDRRSADGDDGFVVVGCIIRFLLVNNDMVDHFTGSADGHLHSGMWWVGVVLVYTDNNPAGIKKKSSISVSL